MSDVPGAFWVAEAIGEVRLTLGSIADPLLPFEVPAEGLLGLSPRPCLGSSFPVSGGPSPSSPSLLSSSRRSWTSASSEVKSSSLSGAFLRSDALFQ